MPDWWLLSIFVSEQQGFNLNLWQWMAFQPKAWGSANFVSFSWFAIDLAWNYYSDFVKTNPWLRGYIFMTNGSRVLLVVFITINDT